MNITKSRAKNGYRFSLLAFAGIVIIGTILGLVLMRPAKADTTGIINPTVFSDNFNNLQLSGWNKIDDTGVSFAPSSWTGMQGASSGVVNSSGNVFGFGNDATEAAIEKPGTYMYNGNFGWTDYEFKVRLKTNDNDGMGVMFHYTDNNNYYRFSMDRERGYMRLIKKVAGTYTVIWENTSVTGNSSMTTNVGTDAYKVGQWYSLSVKMLGSAITLELVDESSSSTPVAMASVSDSSLPSGVVGLYAWGMDAAFFDDVQVTAKVMGGFTIAVLPDTQGYSGFNSNFDAQAQWLADNRAQKKIVYAIHEGDIVNDICSNAEWLSAQNSLKIMDGKIPYSFAPGNHDIIAYGACQGYTDNDLASPVTYAASTLYTQRLNKHLPYGRYLGNANIGGTQNTNTNDMANTYNLFSAGGLNFVVINLQFGPNDASLTWAKSVADAYPTRHAILLTHDYLSENNLLRGTYPNGTLCPEVGSAPTVTRCTATNGPDSNNPSYDWALPSIPGQNSGIKIWDKLVKATPNMKFVFSGHVAAQYGQPYWEPLNGNCTSLANFTTEGSVGRLAQANQSGSTVYQMLANYQTLPNGGNGYMRLLKFTPSGNNDGKWTIDVSTYSPVLNTYLVCGLNDTNRTMENGQLDGKNQFTLTNVSL